MEHLQREIVLGSPEVTERIAASIGGALRGGEVIELISDLGGGKTTFTRGLARGAGSDDVVSSPTFTISKAYDTQVFTIYHFDFYRLPEAGLIAHELEDLLGDPNAVVVVEWGGVVGHVLPEDRVTIRLTKTGDDTRQMAVSCPGNLDYLMQGIA